MGASVLYSALRQRMELGAYGERGTLPSESELAREFGLARGTVRAALERLRREGYLLSTQGRRRTVTSGVALEKLRLASFWHPSRSSGRTTPKSSSFGEYLASIGIEPSDVLVRLPSAEPIKALASQPRLADPELATKLGQRGTAVCWSFLRLRRGDGVPVALQYGVLPQAVVPIVPAQALVPGGFTAYLKRFGITRAAVESQQRASRALRDEARLLGIASGDPLLEERRVSYFRKRGTRTMIPYEYAVTLYPERIALTFSWNDSSADDTPAKRRRP